MGSKVGLTLHHVSTSSQEPLFSTATLAKPSAWLVAIRHHGQLHRFLGGHAQDRAQRARLVRLRPPLPSKKAVAVALPGNRRSPRSQRKLPFANPSARLSGCNLPCRSGFRRSQFLRASKPYNTCTCGPVAHRLDAVPALLGYILVAFHHPAAARGRRVLSRGDRCRTGSGQDPVKRARRAGPEERGKKEQEGDGQGSHQGRKMTSGSVNSGGLIGVRRPRPGPAAERMAVVGASGTTCSRKTWRILVHVLHQHAPSGAQQPHRYHQHIGVTREGEPPSPGLSTGGAAPQLAVRRSFGRSPRRVVAGDAWLAPWRCPAGRSVIRRPVLGHPPHERVWR